MSANVNFFRLNLAVPHYRPVNWNLSDGKLYPVPLDCYVVTRKSAQAHVESDQSLEVFDLIVDACSHSRGFDPELVSDFIYKDLEDEIRQLTVAYSEEEVKTPNVRVYRVAFSVCNQAAGDVQNKAKGRSIAVSRLNSDNHYLVGYTGQVVEAADGTFNCHLWTKTGLCHGEDGVETLSDPEHPTTLNFTTRQEAEGYFNSVMNGKRLGDAVASIYTEEYQVSTISAFLGSLDNNKRALEAYSEVRRLAAESEHGLIDPLVSLLLDLGNVGEVFPREDQQVVPYADIPLPSGKGTVEESRVSI